MWLVHAVSVWLLAIADIPWPVGDEAMTEAARSAVDALLTVDPGRRMMSPGQ